MNFEPAGPLRTSTNLGDRAATTAGRARGFAGEFDTSRSSSPISSPRPSSSLATGSPPPAAAPAPARSPRRCATRASRSPTASRDRSPGATTCRSSTSRRSGCRRTRRELVPLQTLERVVAIPVARHGDRLRVAVADPGNIHGIDELRLASRYPVELGVATRDDILAELEQASPGDPRSLETQSALDDVEVVDETEDDLEVDDGISDAPLVRLVNSIIIQAAEDGASDVHFEPQEDSLVVRFRVDGVLNEVQRIPKRMATGVTTRLKVLAKLDIAERRKPQDGRISLDGAGSRPHARHPRRGAARRSRASRS